MKFFGLVVFALAATVLAGASVAQMDDLGKPAEEQFGNPIPPVPEPKKPLQDWGGLKPGLGREETFYACVPCHTEGRIVRKHMSRDDWAATIDSLTEHNEVPPLEDDERELILDYLAENYGPEMPHP